MECQQYRLSQAYYAMMRGNRNQIVFVAMNRLRQNIIYAGILIAVVGFFWAVVPKTKYEAHAVYLPQTQEIYTPVKAQEVKFLLSEHMNLRKAVPIVTGLNAPPIGIVRVDTHYTSKQEIQVACEKDIQKAKAVAAQYGATRIIGHCIVSGNMGPLEGVNLYAYAYR